jgi:integrase
MGKKITPGLRKRGGVWHIEKTLDGRRLYESTGTGNLVEAERFLARRLEEIRQATVFGVRPERTFEQAALEYVKAKAYKKSIRKEAERLNQVQPWIGHLPLQKLHMGVLQPFIAQRRRDGVKSRTINQALKTVRQVVNFAAEELIDEYGLTWLASAPKIKLLPEPDLRPPRPLSWEEQGRFFQALPDHLATMALFIVNTGLRDAEICGLRWEWEVKLQGLEGTGFILPAGRFKSREEGLVLLNRIAQNIVESQRGKHAEFVFTYRGEPINRMLNTGWRQARKETGIDVRVHDLRHTFGMRLRAAGVGFEDRQDLLRHKSNRITTHYSKAEIRNLLDAVDSICNREEKPEIVLIRRVVGQ